jgi:hypothetical protein
MLALGTGSRTSQGGNAIASLFTPPLPVLAVVVQECRAADRMVRTEPFAVVLDVEILVEQPPPEQHCLAGQVGIDLVAHAIDADGGIITANQPPLRVARKGTESFPEAHFQGRGVGRRPPLPRGGA